MAAIRRSKGISLDQIAETTKISKRFLQAIEDSDFGQLPGGIFNTSYIRQYAQAIDFEESDLLEYYHAVTDGADSGDDGSQARDKSSKGLRLPLFAR